MRFFAHSGRIESACYHESLTDADLPEEVTEWELARYFEMV